MEKKGKFSKSPWKTFTQSVIDNVKVRGTPGPGSYESPRLFSDKKEKSKLGNTER